MKKIHNELTAVSGFIGICLYHLKTGPITAAMPEGHCPPAFSESGHFLIEAYKSGASCLGPIQDAAFYEAGDLIFIKKLSDEVFACILAEPETNLFLLRIALDLISGDLLQRAEDLSPG